MSVVDSSTAEISPALLQKWKAMNVPDRKRKVALITGVTGQG
jgi:hypothetical protein